MSVGTHMAPRFSVVAPFYNEEPITLTTLTKRLNDALAPLGGGYEIILVDDGSVNGAWSVVHSLSESDPRIRGLRFSRNFGQHHAIAAGIDSAQGDWIIVMDSDLQDRPEVIPDLFGMACEGFDVVFVNRAARPEGLLYRLCANSFYRVLGILSGSNHERVQGNFSIISRQVADSYRAMPDRASFYGGTVRWLGYDRAAIQADHGERFSGKPSHRLRSRVRFAMAITLSHSSRLLYVSIAVGTFLAVGSLLLGIFVIADKLANPNLPIPGWPSVMAAVLFAGGITNIMLGLVGLYLGYLVDRAKGRPPYVVAQSVSDPGSRLRDNQGQPI